MNLLSNAADKLLNSIQKDWPYNLKGRFQIAMCDKAQALKDSTSSINVAVT